MKKFLTALICVSALLCVSRAAPLSRKDLVERLESCEAILQDIQGNIHTAIPAEVLHRAKGIVIVNQFQGGFIFGIKDGYAVAMVRRPNGRWSVPAFLRAGEFSFGLQIGGKSVNAVYILLDDQAARLLFKSKMNFGADAKVTAGVRAAERERLSPSLRNDANVLVYTTNEGLYVGATIKTGYMTPHDEANRLFYNSNDRMPELLFSDWVKPPQEARYLMDYVSRLTQ